MLPRVQRIKRGDRVLCYHRPTGTRLPDLPETHPDFVAAWAKAEAGKPDHAPPVADGSLAKAIRSLKASKRWKALSPNYRRDVARNLDAMLASYATAPLKGIRAAHIEADLSKLDPNPANMRLKAWRLVLSEAAATGVIPSDPSVGIRKRQTKSPGHAVWSAADLAAYRDRWPVGTPQRAALELLSWTGARVSDGAKLTRANIADGVLTFRQAKTGGLAHVPWTCPLPAWARGWEAERQTCLDAIGAGFTMLETAWGRARSVKGLSNLVADAAREAGLANRTAHGLRKYRLSAIAEAGGSAHAIMAWGGHATLSEAEHYTRAASRRALVVGVEREQNAVNADAVAVNATNFHAKSPP